jgi:hypothetical protein
LDLQMKKFPELVSGNFTCEMVAGARYEPVQIEMRPMGRFQLGRRSSKAGIPAPPASFKAMIAEVGDTWLLAGPVGQAAHSDHMLLLGLLMRTLKLIPWVVLASLGLVACGVKQAATTTATTTTVHAAAPPIDPAAPVAFATGCASRNGSVHGSICAVTVPNGYRESSGITLSISSDWDIDAHLGLIVRGSGSVMVSVDEVNLGLNSCTSGNSGRLRISTGGDHTLQLWLVQCLDANFVQVDCPATF